MIDCPHLDQIPIGYTNNWIWCEHSLCRRQGEHCANSMSIETPAKKTGKKNIGSGSGKKMDAAF